MCCTNERYKTLAGIFILSPWSCPRGVTLGCWGGGGQFFFQTWSCGISNRRGWRAEQNASTIFILGSNRWHWGKNKRSNIITFWFPCQFHFYNELCVFSQIKDRKHIEQNFHSVAGIIPLGWDLGCWGVKNFSVGIFDGAPSTAHSSFLLFPMC